MAVDIYDSQYLLILAPSLVIALMFLFFWLFMKETSYDEVLAKQKRDLKLPPTKPDTRKKTDKKKSKKKESAVAGGGGGGESEEDVRDFDLGDGVNSSSLEMDEEPALESAPTPAEPTPVYVPPVSAEPPTGLRERKKKEKKAAKAAAAAAAAAAASPATVSSEEPEMNGAKPVSRKADPPTAEKQSSPPSPQVQVEIQVQAQAAAPVQAQQTPPQSSGKKKKKQKTEPVDDQQQEVKPEQAPVPVKKEAPIVAETKAVDGAAPPATGGKKKNAKKQKTEPVEEPLADSPTPANHQATNNDNAPPKSSVKKQKNETDKENTGLKLKELLSGLSSLVMSDAEAVSVFSILAEKSPNALNAWHKSAAKSDPAEQERVRLLTTLQEEASIAKDKVKQFSQELQVEKQKTGRVEAMMRDQRTAMEKELGGMQAKAQGSYQELQTMQIKFQQVREQLESQISRLQQENGILRDAVSSATNQMESKNSAELNKLRSEYAGLRNELADNKSKLQQEEHQRVSLEVSYKQNVSQLEVQLQETKRRWDEVQNYLHTVTAEREKLQASKQELHTQLVAVETERNNKNMEIQTLHSSLTEALVSKEGLEKRVMELLETSQLGMPDDAMQSRVQDLVNENKTLQVQTEMLQAQMSSQANHVSHIEELQKLLADKEFERKSLEDSLNAERSSGAGRETDMQALHNENMVLKAEIQNLQAQIAEQTASQVALDQFQKSVQEREESIKTVEGLLEKGLIEVANKEEELKASREESEVLKQEMDALKKQLEQASSESPEQEYQCQVQEWEMKVNSLQETLKAAQDSSSAQEKRAESLEQQLAALQTETEQLRQKDVTEGTDASTAQLQEVQQQLMAKDQEIQRLEAELEARTKEMNEKTEKQHQESLTAVPSPDLLGELSEKEKQISNLQGELAELRDSVELHRRKNNENEAAMASTQAGCRDVLHRLLPHVPLPSEQNHQEWLCKFEKAVSEIPAAQPTPASGDHEELADKLKEAEESQRILQKDCETYKKVLAETEGILQRLQNSVEQEESRWKLKLEMSQEELKEMHHKVTALEQEIERLTDGGELENLKSEKQHLESELERAERESATYVTEVRELKDLLTELQTRLDGSYTEAIRQNEELNLLKTQLTETLSKLETEEAERQQVAADLYKAQQSLDLIQEELSKVSDNADELIENSTVSSQNEETERKEKMTAGLNQTVKELQQLLHAVSQQLTKGLEGEADKDLPKV